MRINELLYEDNLVDEIMNDLMDIVVTFKQKGEKTIPMQGEDGLLSLLKNIGFDVTAENIMKALTDKKFVDIVKRSSPNEIDLKTSIPDTMASKKEVDKSKEKVAKIAAKASVKAVKSGELK